MDSEQPPDLESRIATLRRRVRIAQFDVPDDVIHLVASSSVDSYFRALEGTLERIAALASLNGVPIDKALAELVLRDLLVDVSGPPATVDKVMAAAAKYFDVTLEEMCTAEEVVDTPQPPNTNGFIWVQRQMLGKGAVTHARDVAMYLCLELTDATVSAIGQAFAGDHHRVMYAAMKIRSEMAERRDVFIEIKELTIRIRTLQS